MIETHRYTLVYDAGPRFNETADAGGRIVAPFLRAAGLRRADGLIISHQDLDHSGGTLSLMQVTPVGWFASSLPAEHPIVVRAQARAKMGNDGKNATGEEVMACIAGQRWMWDDVRFSVLHPTREEYDDARAKTNDRSCVVRIESAYGTALLTGDLEAKSETLLLRTNPSALRADVLVVPHHGSRTSSTPAFINAVAPQVADLRLRLPQPLRPPACGYRRPLRRGIGENGAHRPRRSNHAVVRAANTFAAGRGAGAAAALLDGPAGAGARGCGACIRRVIRSAR